MRGFAVVALGALAMTAHAQESARVVVVGVATRWKAGETVTRTGSGLAKVDPDTLLGPGGTVPKEPAKK